MSGQLQFIEAEHRYELDGEVLPSVTQALESAGLSDFSRVPRDVLEAAKERGTRVHLACAYLDEGDLELSSVAPQEAGYVQAYSKFVADSGFHAELIEARVWSPQYRYAGTLDRFGTIGKQNYLIDIKTGAVTPAAWIQLAAYQMALSQMREEPTLCLRRVLQLREDGTYSLIPPPDDSLQVPRNEFNVFRAALVVHRWKQEHGS